MIVCMRGSRIVAYLIYICGVFSDRWNTSGFAAPIYKVNTRNKPLAKLYLILCTLVNQNTRIRHLNLLVVDFLTQLIYILRGKLYNLHINLSNDLIEKIMSQLIQEILRISFTKKKLF